MAPSWVVSSAIAFVFAGLGIYFRPRRRRPDAANDPPTHVDGANSQDTTNEEAGTVYSCSATTEPSSSSGSISAVPRHEFEVFLSFRGAEIRNTFVSCLYLYLTDLGVRTFIDSEELHVGKEIGPDLMRAIKQSKISVPIFTRGYAESKWCLREVAEMVKCMKDPSCKQHIIPIFLDVTPDEVQHQSGTYAEAFAQHEKKFGTVEGWRGALKEVVKLKGLELNIAANGKQGEFIKLVVAEVLRELRQASSLGRGEILVGLDDRVEEVMKMLEVGTNDVRMVGIWGTGGMGKTTLAKCVYNRIADQFERCSFLSDIRETSGKPGGLLELQRQLVSDILGKEKYDLANTDHGINVLGSRLVGKKSLILLDDVDHINQLKALAADLGWFGSGTRILVTTREKGVLPRFPSCKIYEHQLLDEGRALELFRQHAFPDDLRSADEYDDLSKDIVRITGGLPLALVVIGSFLGTSSGKKDVWHDTIEQLKTKPAMHVQEKLRISYDALDPEQKAIFLDIACFFIGVDYELVVPMWGDCNYFPRLGIEVLQLKSLIKIGYNNQLQMHDQLRDLGRHIVEQENSKEPKLRSRLWRSKEAIDILRAEQGTSNIEAAQIWAEEGEGVCFSDKCFKNLSNLRVLQLRGVVEIAGDFQHLLPKLTWLRWSTWNVSLPANLPLKNLNVLCLSFSGVDEDWSGWNSIKMERLKVLDLSYCRLTRTPDFSAFPNLERLTLQSCYNLVSIDPSIGLLKKLNFLNLCSCWDLKKLPNQLGNLEALTVLIIDYSGVEEIPLSDRMKKLEILSANGCCILNLIPQEIGSLVKLKKLALEYNRELVDVQGINKLTELESVDFSYCTALERLDGVEKLESLKELTLRGCKMIEELPDLSRLHNLHHLNAEGCEKLRHVEGLGELVSLSWLDISGCKAIEELPHLSKLKNLDHLHAKGCEKLRHVEGLGELVSLSLLDIRWCKAIEELPHLSKLHNLGRLSAGGCEKLRHVEGLGELVSLSRLDISGCKAIEELPHLSRLHNLTHLNAEGCEKLRHVEGLGELVSLSDLDISGCKAIEELPDLSRLHNLQHLSAEGCEKLRHVEGLGELVSLSWLDISGCKAIEELHHLSKLHNLGRLSAGGCEKLRHVEGLGELVSLSNLDVSGCKAIEELPHLSRLHNLTHLYAEGCEKLRHVEGLGELVSLSWLDISGCKAIEELPHLSKLHNLTGLHARGCEKLRHVEGLGELVSLSWLDISGCKAIEELPHLSKLHNLTGLHARGCEKLRHVEGLGELVSLSWLSISGCKAIEELPHLSKLQNLSRLYADGCEKLRHVEGLGELVSLSWLSISGCRAIENLPDLSQLHSLGDLRMGGCGKLCQLNGLEELKSLRKLRIRGCKGIEKLPDLSKLQYLSYLDISGCKKLRQLEGIEELKFLVELNISGCKAIEKLPDSSKLQKLKKLKMAGCRNIRVIQGLEKLSNLQALCISGCKLLNLPDLSHQKDLRIRK